jgi:hypothetical protein
MRIEGIPMKIDLQARQDLQKRQEVILKPKITSAECPPPSTRSAIEVPGWFFSQPGAISGFPLFSMSTRNRSDE